MKRNNKNKFKTQNGIIIVAQQLIASKREREREKERGSTSKQNLKLIKLRLDDIVSSPTLL